MLVPALLTRMSTLPRRWTAPWARASTCFRSVMSQTVHSTFAERPLRMSSAAGRSSSSWRLVIITLAPASAKPRAMALPRPRLPPVINADLPERSKSGEAISEFSWQRNRRILYNVGSSNGPPMTCFRGAVDVKLPGKELLNQLDVRRGVRRERRRDEGAGTREGQRDQELIGEVLAHRRPGFQVRPHLLRETPGHRFCTDPLLAEAGKELGDLLRLDLDLHQVAGADGVAILDGLGPRAVQRQLPLQDAELPLRDRRRERRDHRGRPRGADRAPLEELQAFEPGAGLDRRREAAPAGRVEAPALQLQGDLGAHPREQGHEGLL